MIEGLKITIEGTELKELCAKRAQHHLERSVAYAGQLASMEKAEIEGMQYSGGDPKRALRDKKEQHDAEASEMDFIAAHIVTSETYMLDKDALYKLGISKRGY